FITTATLLFIGGAAFSIWTLPRALEFLLGFGGESVVPLITFDRYLGFVTLVTLAFGVSFLFPVVLVFLEAIGVLTWQRLASWRRWTILGIAIFSAVITPSGDPYTMFAMMIPMYLFYETSIIIGRILKR
ncbi:MAG TPA: twin-arginine translocase subunit TatC, partial [Actinomycetota bacterium]